MLDSWLPDGSGIDLCKLLRGFDPRTPIMFLSGAAYETDKQAAFDGGAQCYLVKPCDLEVLSAEVNRLVLAFANKFDQAGVLARSRFSLSGGKDETVQLSQIRA